MTLKQRSDEHAYNVALTNGCLLATAKNLYDPSKPTEVSENTLFFIWQSALERSLSVLELRYFQNEDASAKRTFFETDSSYSYLRFQQNFLRKARRHQKIVLN
jgi:hypothetical protein